MAHYAFPRQSQMTFPANLSRRARIGARFRRRGFTLIEIALAMAVIGLLLGATVMSSRALEERRQIKMEMEPPAAGERRRCGIRPAESDAGAGH